MSCSTSSGHIDNPFMGKKTAKRPSTPEHRDRKRLKLDAVLTGDWLHDLKASSRQLKDELDGALKDNLKREIEVAFGKQTEDIKTYIDEIRSEVHELRSQTEQLREDLIEQRTHNFDSPEGLVRQLNKDRELGDKGYLALHCKSPGRSPTQYEARLTRAAWHYIALMGGPDDGVDEDREV